MQAGVTLKGGQDFAPKALALIAEGRSYRSVGREVGLSKNTVAGIVERSRRTLSFP